MFKVKSQSGKSSEVTYKGGIPGAENEFKFDNQWKFKVGVYVNWETDKISYYFTVNWKGISEIRGHIVGGRAGDCTRRDSKISFRNPDFINVLRCKTSSTEQQVTFTINCDSKRSKKCSVKPGLHITFLHHFSHHFNMGSMHSFGAVHTGRYKM